MANEWLSEYLVRIGFQSDMTSYGRFQATLRDASRLVESQSSHIFGSFLKWQTSATAAFAAIGTGFLGVADKVAMSDQEFRLLALRMYTTVSTARELKVAMDALGAPLEMIAWDPELARRFSQLVKDQQTMTRELGPDFERQMLRIRDVRFEFSRFGVELRYLTMFVVRDLGKILGINLDDLALKLRQWNDWIITNMPRTAEQVGTYLKPILSDVRDILGDTWHLLGMTAQAFANLLGMLSGDKSLESTAVSFEKISRAIQEALGWVAQFIESLIHAEAAALHVINAAVMLKERRYGEAKSEIGQAGQALYSNVITEALARLAVTGVSISPVGATAAAYLKQYGGVDISMFGVGGQKKLDTMQEAMATAKYASAKLGIPWQLILAQWLHETAGLADYKVGTLHNLGGIRVPKTGAYQQFASMKEFADKYISILSGARYAGTARPTTAEQMAAYLKRGGYYEDTIANYAAGMGRWMQTAQKADTYINVLVNVTEPGASAEHVGNVVAQKIEEQKKKQVQRNLAELPDPGWAVSYGQ
jgi:hypothetical protein